MILKMAGRTNAPDQYVKSITYRLVDGSLVNFHWNQTEYVIDGEKFNIAWRGVHTEGRRGSDYSMPARTLRGAEIIDISYSENAPAGYEFTIENWSAQDS